MKSYVVGTHLKHLLISYLFLHENMFCSTHKKRLVYFFLLSTYNICFRARRSKKDINKFW